MHTSEMTKPTPNQRAAALTTSADHYESAAEQCSQAAQAYFNAAGHFDYGDFQQSSEHAKRAKNHMREAEKRASQATQFS